MTHDKQQAALEAAREAFPKARWVTTPNDTAIMLDDSKDQLSTDGHNEWCFFNDGGGWASKELRAVLRALDILNGVDT